MNEWLLPHFQPFRTKDHHMQEDTAERLQDAIRVDAGQLRSHIDEADRSSVEETLNGLLDAEADQICGAARYQRSADRADPRARH